MAETTVFVDDAVTGRLPDLCAKDGVPTHDRLALRQVVGDGARLGVAWLLLLAGPLGWAALVFIASSRRGRGEQLAVQVPLSEAAYERIRLADRQAHLAVLALLGVAGLFVVSELAGGSGLVPVWIVLGLGALAAILITRDRARRAGVEVALDASRRWVTFFNVHPDFAQACREAGSTARP